MGVNATVGDIGMSRIPFLEIIGLKKYQESLTSKVDRVLNDHSKDIEVNVYGAINNSKRGIILEIKEGSHTILSIDEYGPKGLKKVRSAVNLVKRRGYHVNDYNTGFNLGSNGNHPHQNTYKI